MSAHSDSQPDTYRVVLDHDFQHYDAAETLDGSGITDTVKASNLQGIVIANKTFIGTPDENDIDVCRGKNVLIGPNYHMSKPGVSNITAKGGIEGLILQGNFGTAEIGQFSIYDKWFALPPTRKIYIPTGARGTVTLWNAEEPQIMGGGVKVVRVPWIIVKGYFLYRSVLRSLYEGYLRLTRRSGN